LLSKSFVKTSMKVDWSVRYEIPAGSEGQVRPRQREAIGRLTALPAESEQPGAEINTLTLGFRKHQSLLKHSLLVKRDWIPVAFCSLKREGRI
jgi:hypothetical protein